MGHTIEFGSGRILYKDKPTGFFYGGYTFGAIRAGAGKNNGNCFFSNIFCQRMQKDVNGNASRGRWLGLGSKNCLIHAPDRLVVLLGMENAVVVDTPDALLVGDLTRSQEVRELVDQLNRKGLGSYTV